MSLDDRTRELYHTAIATGVQLEGESGGLFTKLFREIQLPKGVSSFTQNTHTAVIKVLMWGSSIILLILSAFLLVNVLGYKYTIDRNVIDIFSLFIGGAGLFGAITKFSSDKAVTPFYDGPNIYALKENKKNKAIEYVFLVIGLIGIFLQALNRIFPNVIKENLKSTAEYIAWAIFALLITFVIVFFSIYLARRIARQYWCPIIIDRVKDEFYRVQEICQLTHSDNLKQEDYDFAQKQVKRIEELLELKVKGSISRNNLFSRVDNIKKYFP